MGTSTDAILAYGYNLGGDESGWEIAEVGEYGELDIERISWMDAADEDDEDVDFVACAKRRLLQSVGFTETDWNVEGYFDRKRAAEESIGVEFDSYCSGEYPMYLLAGHVITVRRGYVEEIDFTALAAQVVDGGWDAKLAAAIQALGITPKQAKPAWLLCSYWSS